MCCTFTVQPPEPVVSLHVETAYSYEKGSQSVELGCVPSFQSEWAPGLLVGWLCVCVSVVYVSLCELFLFLYLRVCVLYGCLCACVFVYLCFLPDDECKANLTQPIGQCH